MGWQRRWDNVTTLQAEGLPRGTPLPERSWTCGRARTLTCSARRTGCQGHFGKQGDSFLQS